MLRLSRRNTFFAFLFGMLFLLTVTVCHAESHLIQTQSHRRQKQRQEVSLFVPFMMSRHHHPQQPPRRIQLSPTTTRDLCITQNYVDEDWLEILMALIWIWNRRKRVSLSAFCSLLSWHSCCAVAAAAVHHAEGDAVCGISWRVCVFGSSVAITTTMWLM